MVEEDEDDTVDGLNEVVTPDGTPEAERAGAPVKPLMEDKAMVTGADTPLEIVREEGVALRVKAGIERA